MSEFMDVCRAAAVAGGEVLMQWRGKITAQEKGPRDLVTQADLASQKTIRELVLGKFPEHDFLGEEDEQLEDPLGGQVKDREHSQFCWIVDPLDGTANYVHGLQGFAVSVALQKDGQTEVGVVFDPISGEMFSAQRGHGSWQGEQRLATSNCQVLEKAMIAASFSPNVGRDSVEVTRFMEVLERCQVMRRLGSAALNLCYVGAGRLDGYWATSVKAWDIAAGMLIVEEAGGVASDLQGGPIDYRRPWFAATASQPLQDELLQALADAERRHNAV